MQRAGAGGLEEEALCEESGLAGENPKEGDLGLYLTGEDEDLTGERFRSIGSILSKDSKLNSATRNGGLNFSKVCEARQKADYRKFVRVSEFCHTTNSETFKRTP